VPASKASKVWVIVFIISLVALVISLLVYATLRKKKKTTLQVFYEQFLNAPKFNRSQLIGTTGTWSLNVNNIALELVWRSNSTNYTVWDSNIGTCGSNSNSFALLSNTAWFDSDTFVPEGLGFPGSYSVLASTGLFQDPLTTEYYSFNLVLYPGMLRIEQDGAQRGVWDNYQGVNSIPAMPVLPVWPSNQDDGSEVLWQLGSVVNCAQFRSNGQFLVGSGVSPFNPPNGFSSWFADLYNPAPCNI
jgi:hypothetical protein